MAYRLELTGEVADQVAEIHGWIAGQSPEQAARWYAGFYEAIGTLLTFPNRCPSAGDSGIDGLDTRLLLCGSRRNAYRILFAVDGEIIRILSVRHSSRADEI